MRSKFLVMLIFLGGFLMLGTAVWMAVPPRAYAGPLLQTPAEGQQLFQQKCQSCHTIGQGKLVGPDLQGVMQRRQPAWVESFITAPDKLIASGDPTATQLLAENNNIPMPNLGLSQTQVAALVAYLQNPTTGGAAAVAAIPQGGNPALGQAIFTGQQRLTAGGTPCIACHSVTGIGALQGGSLGPDLTHVFQRYGAPGLASALQTLPFPTMQGVFLNRNFTPTELADLYAYFEQANKLPATTTAPSYLIFWGIGILGALLLFALMLQAWPRQRHSLSDQIRMGGALKNKISVGKPH